MTDSGTRRVELSRASSDIVQNLAGSGIATSTMVSTLKRESGSAMLDRFDGHLLIGH